MFYKQHGNHELISCEDILDMTRNVQVMEATTYGCRDAVIPMVTGSAWINRSNTLGGGNRNNETATDRAAPSS